MSRERCVFCMEEIKEGAVCPACHKGIWEYDWKEEWLEPYTILKEKYLVGAVSMAGAESVAACIFKRRLEGKGGKRGKAPVWKIRSPWDSRRQRLL